MARFGAAKSADREDLGERLRASPAMTPAQQCRDIDDEQPRRRCAAY